MAWALGASSESEVAAGGGGPMVGAARGAAPADMWAMAPKRRNSTIPAARVVVPRARGRPHVPCTNGCGMTKLGVHKTL